MFKRTVLAILASSSLICAAGGGVASPAPVVGLTTPGVLYGSSLYTLGFEFTASSPQTIYALGVFDDGTALPQDAMVGIWDTSGNLLDSVTVPALGSTQVGLFAYENITPFTLTPGTDYIIGAYLGGTGIASSLGTGQGGTGSVDGNITILEDQFSNFNSAFSFPNETNGNVGGAWLGANFEIAPEPSEWAILLAGIGLAGLALRRRRSVAAA
jgi:hypothetical protein